MYFFNIIYTKFRKLASLHRIAYMEYMSAIHAVFGDQYKSQ